MPTLVPLAFYPFFFTRKHSATPTLARPNVRQLPRPSIVHNSDHIFKNLPNAQSVKAEINKGVARIIVLSSGFRVFAPSRERHLARSREGRKEGNHDSRPQAHE